MEHNELLQQKYARLLIAVGLNLQKGQELVISSPVECAAFARLCAQEAYAMGCREVILRWSDDALSRMKYLQAQPEIFDEFQDFRQAEYNYYADRHAAHLFIMATDPENYKGVDPDRLRRAQVAAAAALNHYYDMEMRSEFPWCVASVPTQSWAAKVFPKLDNEGAMDALEKAIFSAVRVDENSDPVENWKAHIATMGKRTALLNQYAFDRLHYENSLGTDLWIGLPDGHVWMSGDEADADGNRFVANMPTEEIFTAPHRERTNGVVHAALPLVYQGSIIEDFSMTLKDGKIVEVHARTNQELLEQAISLDEGAAYLGEVALVPYSSPISDMKLLFFNTLFDENASCHLAFGQAYPTCLKDAQKMEEKDLIAAGLNRSDTHVDFMVGTSDLSITGFTKDGKSVPVIREGNFVLA